MPRFHSPPARRGIYAFVAEAVSHFLLGQEEFDSRRAVWARDGDGRRIPSDSPIGMEFLEQPEHISRTASDGKRYVARHKKPKYFDYDGEIWHHLPMRRNEIILQKGSWVLTTAQAHREAFKKEFGKRIRAVERARPALLLDHFEVFIEKL